jgi:anti-sigma-K factor RskA
MSSAHDTCTIDAAPYVLGSLEADEAERYRAHMSTCDACQAQVAALQGAANALPLSVPQMSAPSALKRKLARSLRAEPNAGDKAIPRRPRTLTSLPLPFATGMAAVAAALAILITLAVDGTGPATVRVVHATVAAMNATAHLRISGDEGQLIVANMPQPPPSKLYEVWVVRSRSAPQSTNALFGVTSTGAGTVQIPGGIRGVREVLVTPEPRTGSSIPTHAPVIVAKL